MLFKLVSIVATFLTNKKGVRNCGCKLYSAFNYLAMQPPTEKNRLSTIAASVTIAGGIGSLLFTLYAGRHNQSSLLVMLFVIWVTSPFAGLLWISYPFRKNAKGLRSVFYVLMITISVCSLIAYSGILIPTGTKNAFLFLVFPLLSWFVIIIAVIRRKKI